MDKSHKRAHVRLINRMRRVCVLHDHPRNVPYPSERDRPPTFREGSPGNKGDSSGTVRPGSGSTYSTLGLRPTLHTGPSGAEKGALSRIGFLGGCKHSTVSIWAVLGEPSGPTRPKRGEIRRSCHPTRGILRLPLPYRTYVRPLIRLIHRRTRGGSVADTDRRRGRRHPA